MSTIIQQIRAELEAATPRPWKLTWDTEDDEDYCGVTSDLLKDEPDILGFHHHLDAMNDFSLIVTAVNALPALLDVAEAAWLYAMDDTPAVDHFKRLDALVEALRKLPQKLPSRALSGEGE